MSRSRDPDALIVQDPTLLHQVNLFAGLRPEGFLLVNTSRTLDDARPGRARGAADARST